MRTFDTFVGLAHSRLRREVVNDATAARMSQATPEGWEEFIDQLEE